jgi:hypothetical protein
VLTALRGGTSTPRGGKRRPSTLSWNFQQDGGSDGAPSGASNVFCLPYVELSCCVVWCRAWLACLALPYFAFPSCLRCDCNSAW